MAKKMATKKSAKSKKSTKKSGKKSTKKSSAKKSKARPASASNTPRVPWFDAANDKPLISEYAQRLQPFLDTMADGRVDDGELRAQEGRLIASMKDVEPMLAGPVHGKVTRLLCEMAAYDLMQALHTVQASRGKTVFRG